MDYVFQGSYCIYRVIQFPLLSCRTPEVKNAVLTFYKVAESLHLILPIVELTENSVFIFVCYKLQMLINSLSTLKYLKSYVVHL